MKEFIIPQLQLTEYTGIMIPTSVLNHFISIIKL